MLLRIEIMVFRGHFYIFRSLKKRTRERDQHSKRNARNTLLCCLYMTTNYNIMKEYRKMEQCYRGNFSRKIVIVVKGGEKLPKGENVAINAKGGDC